VRELAAGLRETTVELDLALIGKAPEPPIAGVRSCRTRELRLEWMEDPWGDVSTAASWVEELCTRCRPDVLHLNTFTPVLDPHVPVLLTVHSCVLTWWRAVHGVDPPPAWSRYRILGEAALARADLLSTPSGALLDALRSVYGELPPARVVHNGRGAAEVEAVGGTADLETGRRERLVVSAGRIWDEGKNAQLLAAAAASIRAPVCLIGPGSVPGVRCVGALAEAEVRRWLARAAVFVEAARYEPFGLAVLEAALAGCALVLGEIPTLREIWGSAATYVAPDDPVALAQIVNSLLDDRSRLHEAARAARMRAARYTTAAMAHGYLELYEQLANARAVAA
jgi:glycosyltransferase involved in cell wall biosynthesis